MSKVTFTFDSHEDHEELQVFYHAADLRCALSEIYSFCRNKLKYESPGEEASAILETIRAMTIIDGLDN